MYLSFFLLIKLAYVVLVMHICCIWNLPTLANNCRLFHARRYKQENYYSVEGQNLQLISVAVDYTFAISANI